MKRKGEITQYGELLTSIKQRIRQAQVKATLSANAEMILLYWDIGRMIHLKQQKEGWGSAVIPRLSKDIRNELSEVKGFSERNIGRMIAFYKEYSKGDTFLPQTVAKMESPGNQVRKKGQLVVAQLESTDNSPANQGSQKVLQLVAQLPWGHNNLLLEKVKEQTVRFWYMHQTIENGWSRDTLNSMIKTDAYTRQGSAVTNFTQRLPAPQSEFARQLLKDPYIFDFMTLEEPFHERELEVGLIQHLEKFLLELGQGFAFVGRQYPLAVSDKDFYLDLLFYHYRLHCFVVVELKRGEFKPEYAGKMNFYCSVVDDQVKQDEDQPTIGLILCQTKDKILAEYALRDIHKPIGISDYELTRALPDNLKSSLPSIEEIEKELSRGDHE